MGPLFQEVASGHSPDSLAAQVRREPGMVLLHSGSTDGSPGRYSFVAARPFLRPYLRKAGVTVIGID